MGNEEDKHRHHIQPKFYLKGFAAKSSNPYQRVPDIWVYKKGEPYVRGQNPYLDSINNVGYRENFYAFTEDNGATNFNKYENLLMKDFEQKANPVIEKIRRLEEINETEKILLSRYIASMILRGEWWRDKQQESKDRQINLTKEKFNESEKIVDEKAKTIWGQDFDLKDMISRIGDLSDKILKMNWRFLVAPKDMYYIISDVPVVYSLEENKECVIFPISSKVAFLALLTNGSRGKWRKISDNFWEVDAKTIEAARSEIATKAIKKVYYSQKAEWLVKFINNRIDK
jgi:Protein of unknown function (DUF4238)